VTFSVIVSVSIDAFDADLRRQYIVDVARALSIDPSSVSITSVRGFVARRAGKPQIEVVTSVVVPPDTVASLKQDIARNELTMTIHGVLVALTILEEPTAAGAANTTSVTTTPLTEVVADGYIIQTIIFVTTAVVVTVGALLVSWRLCTRSGFSQDHELGPDVEADAFNVVPAAGLYHLAPPPPPPQYDVEGRPEPMWA
jgi:hypothetical protein